jgi:hypothetical protein
MNILIEMDSSQDSSEDSSQSSSRNVRILYASVKKKDNNTKVATEVKVGKTSVSISKNDTNKVKKRNAPASIEISNNNTPHERKSKRIQTSSPKIATATTPSPTPTPTPKPKSVTPQQEANRLKSQQMRERWVQKYETKKLNDTSNKSHQPIIYSNKSNVEKRYK